MRYELGRFHRPMRRSTESQLVGLVSLGDGSTLTLDFTTGVLDPRLTFTRASNATFINSGGLVQYADANMVVNADFVGAGTGNTPTAWTGSAGINLTIPATGVRRAETTTAAQNWTGSPNFTTSNGLTYSTSVQINAVSGQHYANTLTITGSPTVVGYYLNGSSVGQFSTAQPGLLTIVWIATGTHAVRVGIGSTGANVPNAVCEFTQPRTVPGNFTQPAYFANSSTTAAYHAPRFDHDPTTQAPRGLLIEGAATNLFNWSEAFDTTGGATNWNWSVNVTRGTVTTTNPAGASATVIKIEETTTNGLHAPLTVPTVLASTTYTFSVWAKAVERTFVQLLENGGSGANSMVNLSTGAVVSESTAGITTVTAMGTTGWYRIAMRLTTIVGQTTANCQLRLSTDGTTTSYAGTTGSGIYIWGAQLEQASGASSYIPTGASTVQRLADICYMANTDYGFTTNGGTYLAEWNRGSIISAGSSSTNAFSTDYASGRWLGIYTAGASSTGTAGSWSGYLNSSGAVAGINKMAVSYSSWVASASGNTSLNGGAIVSGTLTLGTTPTYLFIGAASSTSPYSGGGYRDPLNNCVRRIKYWPTVLSNAQLQALTT